MERIIKKLREKNIIQDYVFSEEGKHTLMLKGKNKPKVLLDTTKKTWYLLGEIVISEEDKHSLLSATHINQIVKKQGLIGHFDINASGYIYTNSIPHFFCENDIIGTINMSLITFEFIFESLIMPFKKGAR